MNTNKTALVTGATSGIGLAIAHQLAQNGYNIIFNGFADKDTIATVEKSLKDHGVESLYIDCDLSKPDSIEKMFNEIEDKFNKIDVLVNNAGVQHVSPITEFSDAKWDSVIAIDLSASFHTIKRALPLMRKNNFGRIINIASVHGKVASINKAGYVAAKHGVLGLSKVVALETAEENITSNCICPGWVYTPIVEKQIADNAKAKNISIAQAEKELLEEKQPSLQFVKPEDIGQIVVFLSSDAASQITGSEITADGGWTAR